jgi:hypothetical protein
MSSATPGARTSIASVRLCRLDRALSAAMTERYVVGKRKQIGSQTLEIAILAEHPKNLGAPAGSAMFWSRPSLKRSDDNIMRDFLLWGQIYNQRPSAMQSDGCVKPTQRDRCFAEDVRTAAAFAGGDGEVELRACNGK